MCGSKERYKSPKLPEAKPWKHQSQAAEWEGFSWGVEVSDGAFNKHGDNFNGLVRYVAQSRWTEGKLSFTERDKWRQRATKLKQQYKIIKTVPMKHWVLKSWHLMERVGPRAGVFHSKPSLCSLRTWGFYLSPPIQLRAKTQSWGCICA